MNILTYRFTLDTQKNGVQRVLQGFQTGEHVARRMEITLKEGPENYVLPLSNISASMYVKRPSQAEPSINACTIDSANNKIIYLVTDQDITEAGTVEMQLKLINTIGEDTTVLVSPMFGMEVWESNIEDSSAESTPTYSALTEALAAAEAMKDSAIADLYIDENNIFTVVFGDGTTYTSNVIADAIGRIGSVETYALKSEGYAVGTQNNEEVGSGSPYYHNNSQYYAGQAGTSASNAHTSETNAATSETNAGISAANALSYKNAAYTSEQNASDSETNALSYKNAAHSSEVNAASSETNAGTSASNAHTSEVNAETSASNAHTSEINAATSETNAGNSATSASNSAADALTHSRTSKSYATGGTGTRVGEETDNAKYYKERCEQIASSLEGGFLPMGTLTFAALPDLANTTAGWMYNISDAFVSDSRFKDGGGISYGAGANAYVTADKKWDVLESGMQMINGKTGASINLDGSDIAMTNYVKPQSTGAITANDSINDAIGKLEAKADEMVTGVSSFNGRTGDITPKQDDYSIGQIKATGSTGQVPALNSSGKLAMVNTVKSFNGRTGAVNPQSGDYTASLVPMTNYSKAGTPAAVSASDSALSAIGKVEKLGEVAQYAALANADYNEFPIPTTAWMSNTETATMTDYPYIATFGSDKFADDSHPIWQVFGTGKLPTEAETEAIGYIAHLWCDSDGITLYASDLPTVALVLCTMGADAEAMQSEDGRVYIYKGLLECSDKSGGWQKFWASIVVNEGGIGIESYYDDDTYGYIQEVSNALDLSSYTKMYVEYKGQVNDVNGITDVPPLIVFFVSNNQVSYEDNMNWEQNSVDLSPSTTPTTVEIDISNLEHAYITLASKVSAFAGQSLDAYSIVYKVWFE